MGVVGGRKEIFEPSRTGTGLYLIKSERIHLFANLCSCRPGGAGRLGSLSTRRINILQLSLAPLCNNQKEYRNCIVGGEYEHIAAITTFLYRHWPAHIRKWRSKCGGDECPREHNFAIKHAAAHQKKGIRLGTVSEFRIGYKSDFLSEFSIISL